MNRLLTACAIVSAGIAASAASPVRVIRTVETREPADHALGLVHGETIELRVRLLNYTEPIDLSESGWAITLHGRTNGQSEAESYSVTGYVGTADSVAAASEGWASAEVDVSAWWPATASSGTWTLLATNASARIARAGGPLTVRGTAAADVMAPVPQSVADGLRAQWLADIAAATNALPAAGSGTAGGIDPAQIAAWFATGTVARATQIERPDGSYWHSISNNAPVTWCVADDTNRLYIVSVAGADYDGPAAGRVFARTEGDLFESIPPAWYVSRTESGWMLIGGDQLWGCEAHDLPQTLSPVFAIDDYYAHGTCVLDYAPVTNAFPAATDSDIAAATNALVQTYLLGTNAWMTISNQTLTISRAIDGVETSLWSSAESGGGGDTVDLAFTNALWSALAGKADKAWGQYAPDGSANPDPAYMTYLNSPATMHASGFRWATFGTFCVLAQSGTVAFESGADGEARWGLDLHTNYVAFVRGSNVVVGASAGGIAVADGEATIVYAYAGGDFPVLWFSPSLDTPFTVQSGVVWVDNEDGTATVTAPAETPAGFWYASTTAQIDVVFDVRPPARLSGGVFGAPGALPVVYDSVIEIESGGKTYRIPAQEVP